MPSALIRNQNRASSKNTSSYALLRKRVQETLLAGQKRIEQQKVLTYWETGKLIQQHILLNKERAEFGKSVIDRLAEDLEISESVLRRTVQFYQAFPISATSRKLTWAHYCELLPIKEEESRENLAVKAEHKDWSVYELRRHIRNEFQDKKSSGVREDFQNITPLKPKLGTLYTYRIIETITQPGILKIDQGFKKYSTSFEPGAKLKSDTIAESKKNKDGTYFAVKSNRTEADLFTYKAFIERVVDGDTLFVEIDLGLGDTLRDYLRLRGIEAPELSTSEGIKARDFVRSQVKNLPFIFLTTTRSDKFDRYLSDVFLPGKEFLKQWADGRAILSESKELLFLNSDLLKHGHAVRAQF